MLKSIHALILLLLASILCRGQDPSSIGLEKLKELKNISVKDELKKGIKVSGMAGANFVYYHAAGIADRNIPFNMLFTGNLNIDLFGKVKMPVSFSLSNQNINWSHPFDRKYQFMQPFNRFVLKPTYKGFTLQAGVCSMNFSPFTLAGHRFDGVGLEYKSKQNPFYFGLMLGNLRRAIRVDTSRATDRRATDRYNYSNNIPSYKRSGVGVQLGYRKQEDKIELIFFTASDKLRSLPYSLDDYNISPEQNAVVSLKGAKVLKKKWVFDGEIAVSGITHDTRAPRLEKQSNLINSYLGTISPGSATEYKKAIKTAVTYRGKGFNTGIEYSRIDPGYRTLGAYYFANDLETYAGKLAGQLLAGKLNVSANAGIQQDNVQKQKLKTLKRWVGALNVTYVPAEWITAMLSYSNFTSFSNLRPTYDYLKQITPYQALDTLNFKQINQHIQAGVNVVLPAKNEDITQNIGLNLVMQRGSDRQGDLKVKNNLSNTSLDYSCGVKPLRMNISAALYYSDSDISGLTGKQWGPSLGFAKGFGSKDGIQWKTQFNGTYTSGKMDNVSQSMLNLRAGLSASLTRQLNLTTNIIYLDRKNISTERYIPSFREITATLGLVYNFSVL